MLSIDINRKGVELFPLLPSKNLHTHECPRGAAFLLTNASTHTDSELKKIAALMEAETSCGRLEKLVDWLHTQGSASMNIDWIEEQFVVRVCSQENEVRYEQMLVESIYSSLVTFFGAVYDAVECQCVSEHCDSASKPKCREAAARIVVQCARLCAVECARPGSSSSSLADALLQVATKTEKAEKERHWEVLAVEYRATRLLQDALTLRRDGQAVPTLDVEALHHCPHLAREMNANGLSLEVFCETIDGSKFFNMPLACKSVRDQVLQSHLNYTTSAYLRTCAATSVYIAKKMSMLVHDYNSCEWCPALLADVHEEGDTQFRHPSVVPLPQHQSTPGRRLCARVVVAATCCFFASPLQLFAEALTRVAKKEVLQPRRVAANVLAAVATRMHIERKAFKDLLAEDAALPEKEPSASANDSSQKTLSSDPISSMPAAAIVVVLRDVSILEVVADLCSRLDFSPSTHREKGAGFISVSAVVKVLQAKECTGSRQSVHQSTSCVCRKIAAISGRSASGAVRYDTSKESVGRKCGIAVTSSGAAVLIDDIKNLRNALLSNDASVLRVWGWNRTILSRRQRHKNAAS